jgi:tetratricopeptide (TPR) repeat protein
MPPTPLADRDHPLLREAITLWNKGEFERSLFAYERALAADPSNARVIINAARALLRRNRPSDGLALLRRLVDAGPDDPRVHHMVGETCRLCTLPSRAIEAFEAARRLGDRSAKSAMELAALYEQAGRLDEAMALVESVPASDPARGWADLVLGMLLRRGGQLDRAREVLGSLGAKADPRTELYAQAWAELATVLDGSGEHGAAWDAIERCKAAQRPHEGPSLRASEHVARRFGAMALGLTPERVRAWADRLAITDPSPIALLAGFPRSGTTLLEQVVDAHPGVQSVEERDVLAGEVFPSLVHGHPPESDVLPILDAVSRKQAGRLRARYADALRGWAAAAGSPKAGAALLLDKNPGATPLVPVLRLLCPGAPVLLALRDPRDVVLSCYMRYLQLNPLSVNFLTIERTAAKYAQDMSAWLHTRAAHPDAWCEVRYEELVDDLEGTARRALTALGMPWDPSVLAYRDRLRSKIVTSPTHDKVREPVTRRAVGRWKNYERMIAPAMPHLEPFLRAFGYA